MRAIGLRVFARPNSINVDDPCVSVIANGKASVIIETQAQFSTEFMRFGGGRDIF
jgi:hypothetical protein